MEKKKLPVDNLSKKFDFRRFYEVVRRLRKISIDDLTISEHLTNYSFGLKRRNRIDIEYEKKTAPVEKDAFVALIVQWIAQAPCYLMGSPPPGHVIEYNAILGLSRHFYGRVYL